MTSTVSVLKSVLPNGASSSANQTLIKQAIEDTNDNSYNTQSISLSSGVVSNSQTIDTATFQQIVVVVEETASNSSFQIEWSPDDATWYYPDASSTTFSNTGVDGVSSQNIGTSKGLCKMRYARIALYNASSSSTVNVITTLLH